MDEPVVPQACSIWLFAFQRGVTVAHRSELALPDISEIARQGGLVKDRR